MITKRFKDELNAGNVKIITDETEARKLHMLDSKSSRKMHPEDSVKTTMSPSTYNDCKYSDLSYSMIS